MAGRIVLFGATGYTGRLVAEAMVGRGTRPVLAGRDGDALALLADRLGGLETAVADVSRPGSVRALVEEGDVLVTTVGPFARWGEAALDAAIDARAVYIDSTGEPQFIRRVFEREGPRAQAAGTALLTAFGYDWVPGNLAGALALRAAGPRTAGVRIGYFLTGSGDLGGMSGGTRASLAGALIEPQFAYRGGRLVTERGAARVGSFDVQGRTLAGISVGTSEAFALPRLEPGLRDVEVYLGWFGPMSRAMQAFSAVSAPLMRIPPLKHAVDAGAGRFVKGSTGGPDAEARAGSGSEIVAQALDVAGDVIAEARLRGVNGYDFTGRILAWAAESAAEGGVRGTGALGPADGFGLDDLEAGAAQSGLEKV
jgi:short subunit dehydrogenase-like uncharacterized protein